ncbi:hypothetical protein Tco_0870666 [Tanacetum coccineum]
MGNVKKFVAEKTRHQRQYDRRVNKRQIQTQDSKIDTSKAVDADLVVTESSRTESEVQDNNNKSGNDTDTDDTDTRPIYDKKPMFKIQLTTECNIFATRQQHTEQPEIINEVKVDQYTEQCHIKSPMLDLSPDNKTIDNKTAKYSNQSLESENICLKKIVAQFQKDFSRMEAHCIALELKNQNQDSKSGQHGQILNETITQHHLPKGKESAFAKPIHMIASSSSRNSSKNMPRFISNDMFHNHYLDEVRKKTQERDRNSKTSVMPSARFQSTADGSKPKPRSTNHSTRSLPTRNTNKPIEQKSHTQKPVSQIFTEHRFSPNKTFAMYEKTSPRYDLRWKPTGRIFKSISLRWVPTGKILASCTSKDDSEPTHGTSNNVKPDNLRVWLLKKLISHKPVLKWIQN